MREDRMANPFVWFDAVGCGHEMQSFSSKPFLLKSEAYSGGLWLAEAATHPGQLRSCMMSMW